MSDQTSNKVDDDFRIPLREWIAGVGRQHMAAQPTDGAVWEKGWKDALLRTTTVAYGLAELLRRARSHRGAPSAPAAGSRVSMANFAVRYSVAAAPTSTDIKGLEMLSPHIRMNIVEPSFLRDDADQGELPGRYLEVEYPTLPEDAEGTAVAVSQSEEDTRCHSLGVILYELFSHISILSHDVSPGGNNCGSQPPAPKKTRLLDFAVGNAGKKLPHAASRQARHIPLVELGFPSSISMLVQNLLECRADNRPDNAYDSLDAVTKDLHLLLIDPLRFLLDRKVTPDSGREQLSFRERTLYGREKEVSLITDAFCRVSTGKCEAFFIAGFSGSGKSRLVHSLTARVDIAGGYVLTHKFEQRSQERPLLEVISVFNNLCALIKEKRTPQDLRAIADRLADVFGADFSMLAQLLPNVHALAPRTPTDQLEASGVHMKFRSVCFVLQRFVKVVGSKAHPVMVFLDDLQWCDRSALTLIEGMLCDASGARCFFFVGSYRSNEVVEEHAIFRLIDSLGSAGVPITELQLEGLGPEDLNAMISDAMGMFPRISEPLSDIVFQKTKGNPFFVLQFLRSLVEGGFLEYNTRKRLWLWDEERVSSMDIMGNVLSFLASKMTGLSKNIQMALKVASCFGIKIKESIVDYLSTKPEYFTIQHGMEHAVKEGFMHKVVGTSEFKFVHDKIREAAYSLVPENEKKMYHYTLGITLYPITTTKGSNLDDKGNQVDDLIFCITDQINHGVADVDSSERSLDLAKLNEVAGVRAMDLSDYTTACSYLNTTMSLLPTDHWKHHYDLSLRSYFLLAKSAHSAGDVDKADAVLQEILHQANCLRDKLDSYLLVVTILINKQALGKAYMMAHDVLVQLGQSIPTSFGKKDTKVIVNTTSKLICGQSLLKMKEMESKEQFILQFYEKISTVAFLAKPPMVPFFICRMIQVSMTHGICKFSSLGFVQYAAMLCVDNTVIDIEEACKIGKLAMSLLKRFDSATDQLSKTFYTYHGMVSIYTEPLQSCVNNLRRGFECGIASGDTSSGFINALYEIGKALIAGTHLPTLLKRTNYYIETMKIHKNTLAETTFILLRDTIQILMMGREGNNSLEAHIPPDASPGMAECAYYHRAIRAFWIGHSESSHHFIEKVLGGTISGGRNYRSQIMLYYGLNCFRITRRTGSLKLKGVPRNALKTLKTAASYSSWNFGNKVCLLEAEIFSREGKHEEAKASYASAITSARCSIFVHEQGLACELAGFHYKKKRENENASNLFNQAKQCYAVWGSQLKVDSMTRQLEMLQI